MNNEQKIISTLGLVLEKLDEHLERFDKIDNRFETVDSRFDKIDNRFESVDSRFDKIDKRFESVDSRFNKIDNRFETMDSRFNKIDKRFEMIDVKLNEHSEHLSALRTGQEFLKAEIDGMKISNTKEFGAVKNQMDEFSLSFSLLRDDVWEQKVHIERIKKTMGMA